MVFRVGQKLRGVLFADDGYTLRSARTQKNKRKRHVAFTVTTAGEGGKRGAPNRKAEFHEPISLLGLVERPSEGVPRDLPLFFCGLASG